MATVGQVYYNVIDNNSGGYISSSDIDIYKDIVSAYGALEFTKLGIQAPPGTKMVMNGSKSIMVGRTGIYELDTDIIVTNLYFIRPRKYVKDEEASAAAKEAGTRGMIEAENVRKQSLKELNELYPDIPTSDTDPNYEDYWNKYNEIQEIYIAAYQAALSQFNTGSNGIYVLPNPNNEEAPENYEDLYNIIVDFIYD